jgi:serine/threonine protein kinase
LQKVKLGQGSFGTVWRAVDKHNDRVVAIKQLDKATMPKRQVTRKDIEREVELMKAVKHENITQLYDTFEDERSIFLALEYCDGGDFGDKVKERGMSLREEEAADWVAQICAAIAALHTKGICHRDIKPDNFMVAVSTLKLSDFGLACFLPRGKLLTDKCGTPAFMAPEQVNLPSKSRGYSFPCDMWAAGISMYMLMFGGRHPFLTANNQLDDRALCQGKMDFREAAQPTGGFLDGLLGGARGSLRFSDKAREICSRMVQPDPARRITAEDALRDNWPVRLRRKPSKDNVAQAAPPPIAASQGRPQNGGYPAQDIPGVFPTAKKPPGTQTAAQMQMMQQQHAEHMRKIQSLESKNEHLQKALITAKATAGGPPQARSNGPLKVGMKCRYYSTSYGWMNGVVQGFNDQDGTYNLDIRQHAGCDKISPIAAPAGSDDHWPLGTWVAYESSSYGYIAGVVVGYNDSDNTYNLDVREHAAIDKIRARDMSGASSATTDEHGRPGNTPTDGMRTENNQGVNFGFELPTQQNMPLGGDSTPLNGGMTPQHLQQTMGRTNSTSNRVPDGSKCMLVEQQQGYGSPEYVLSLVEGFNSADGSYMLLVDPHNSRRRQQVRPEVIRAPKGEDAWPAGTQVFYETSSQTQYGKWLPAQILSFNSANGTYNLDVRENAAPERVRPR